MFDIKIDRDGEETLYRQIYEQMKAEILQDRYTPDTKLPSIRKLAARLKVNTETVVKAYNLLAAENLIYKKEGSGSYIAPAAAYKSSKDDQRLRVLSSQKSAAKKIFDFSGTQNSREYLKEFAFDLIFDRLYSQIEGEIFSELENDKNQWYQLLTEINSSYDHLGLYYDCAQELQNIVAELISSDDLILFEAPADFELFQDIFNTKADKIEKDEQQLNNLLKVSNPDYETLMDYLEKNKIEYLVISDEPAFVNILDWNLSKIKSLFELADMLKFKIIILESYYLYQKNTKIEELLNSKYRSSLILIRELSNKIFPGLELGLIFIPDSDESRQKNKNNLLDRKYSVSSSGRNILENMLSYYKEKAFLEKRIKLLKQRLKNRNLLLEEELPKYFKNIKIKRSSSLFYQLIEFEEEIDQERFKNFAEKNGVLLPNYRNFLIEQISSKMVISPAALDQFNIKQGIMNLANIYRQFNS